MTRWRQKLNQSILLIFLMEGGLPASLSAAPKNFRMAPRQAPAVGKQKPSKVKLTTLQVKSNVPADISIDGINYGKSGELIEISPGKVIIELTAAGYQRRRVSTTIYQDRPNMIKVNLDKVQPKPLPPPKAVPKTNPSNAVAAKNAASPKGMAPTKAAPQVALFGDEPPEVAPAAPKIGEVKSGGNSSAQRPPLAANPPLPPPAYPNQGNPGYSYGPPPAGAYPPYQQYPQPYAYPQPMPIYPVPVPVPYPVQQPQPAYPYGAPYPPPQPYPYGGGNPYGVPPPGQDYTVPPPPEDFGGPLSAPPPSETQISTEPKPEEPPPPKLVPPPSSTSTAKNASQPKSKKNLLIAILPFGAGQFQNKSYVKAGFFLVSEITCLYLYKKYDDDASAGVDDAEREIAERTKQSAKLSGQQKKTYDQETEIYRSQSEEYVNASYQNREYAKYAFLGLWAVGVADAIINEPSPPKAKKKKSRRSGFSLLPSLEDRSWILSYHFEKSGVSRDKTTPFSVNFSYDPHLGDKAELQMPQSLGLQIKWEL